MDTLPRPKVKGVGLPEMAGLDHESKVLALPIVNRTFNCCVYYNEVLSKIIGLAFRIEHLVVLAFAEIVAAVHS